MAKQCSAKRADGGPCKGRPLKDGLCLFHATSPELVRRRRAGRRKGGLRSTLRPTAPDLPQVELQSKESVLQALSNVANRVARGEIAPRVAGVIIAACGVAVRLLEDSPEGASVIFEVHPPPAEAQIPDDPNLCDPRLHNKPEFQN
jgi:hypothetical protein